MEILSTTKPKARKDHKCDFCNGIIKVGEKYDYQTNKFDGIIYNWKTHSHCTSVASHYDLYDDWGEGLSGDDFQDGVREKYYELFGEYLESIPEMAVKLYERINK